MSRLPPWMRPGSSVRGKLAAIVMLSALVVLLITGIAMLAHDLSVYRRSWAADVATEANILALSSAPALAFDDREEALRNLDALRSRASVVAAALYTAEGQLYANYARDGQARSSVPARPPDFVGLRVEGTQVRLVQPIEFNDEILGHLYLEARYELGGRIRGYLTIFSVIAALSLAAALALSEVLQRVLTTPLEEIADVARRIVHERDYSLRVPRRTADEIGLVVEALNRLLEETEQRTRALEQSNDSLRDEIAVRQKAERQRRETESVYRAIGESMDYGVWVADARGRPTYFSESYLRLVGLTLDEVKLRGVGELLHPDEREAYRHAWEDCVRRGGTWYRETRVVGADGRFHPVLSQAVPIRGDGGELLGWAGLNLDISRLKRTEEALRQADRRKDEFLATLAHELRNPLAPIRHATRILDTTTATPEQRRWGRDVIARQVQHMALLLDDLLDVSRITRGRLELRRQAVALESLVGSAIETARPLLDARQHRLEVHLPEEPVELDVDPLRLAQALSNLLTNAAKYTDTGGHIVVSARRGDEGLVLAVKDNGIGLQPGALDRVFEMFSQVESALERSQGGLGIGLALVKGLVELHGGSVGAVSDGPGRGSTFTIRLPTSVIRPGEQAPSPRPREPEVPPTASRTVLVVDDNRDAAESLSLILRLRGHRVSVAHDGAAALATGARERPDVCILDIGMPGMTGYELAMRIRQQPWGRQVQLFAVTGWGQREDKEQARAAGFDRHFTKPVDPAAIERSVAESAGSATPA